MKLAAFNARAKSGLNKKQMFREARGNAGDSTFINEVSWPDQLFPPQYHFAAKTVSDAQDRNPNLDVAYPASALNCEKNSTIASENVAIPLHVFAVIGCSPLKMLGGKLHRSAHVCNMRLGIGTTIFFN